MPANQAESASWNGARGLDWVRSHDVMDAFLAPILELTLKAARLKPGDAVLDIGCGAGATTQAAARAVGPVGRALGLDISVPLVEHARTLASGLDNATFLVADAQTHDFQPEFDVLISRFGVMFFDDPIVAFANMARALRPGGRVAVMAWARLDLNPCFSVPVRVAEPWLGPAPPQGDAPGPMAFSDIARVEGILRSAGLIDAFGTRVETILTPPGKIDAVVDLALNSGPVARLIATKSPSEGDLQAIRAACRDAMLPFVTKNGIRIPASVNLYQARLPG